MRPILRLFLFCALSAIAGERPFIPRNFGQGPAAPAPPKYYPPTDPELEAKRQARITELAKHVKDPLRLINGVTNYAPRAEGWVKFSGKVLSVAKDGILVKGDWCPLDETSVTTTMIFFVANWPYQVADDDSIRGWPDIFMARRSGTHRYTSLGGFEHTVHRLDYGALPAQK